MAEAPLSDLNYGHSGPASYHLESGEWLFGRQYSTRSLKQVPPSENSQQSQTQVLAPSSSFPTQQLHPNRTKIKKNFKRLVRVYPQIAPAFEKVPEAALLSSGIQSATSTYDPSVGNLLSFGSITLEDRHQDPRRIAASPTGEGGNILRLTIVTQERHAWADDRSCWVEGPSLKDADSGYWNEEAAPIQQVCFAQSEDRSTLLAVRLLTRTVIFRPVYHRHRQSANNSPYFDLPASVIDAHPILSILLEQTGGAPHADVTFNPDYQLQFGVVDQKHSWSVWDIEHSRKGDSYTASCLVRGNIDPSEDAITLGEDGWSRMLWVGDVNTLVVCNRRVLNIFDIKGGSCTPLPCPKLISKRSSDWILDVKNHPKHRGRCFVLTSNSLALMSITSSSEDLDATNGEPGACVLVSWKHYRDDEDFTLHLSVQMLSDEETCVIIHSRLNNILLHFIFRDPQSSASPLVLCSDPSSLSLVIEAPQRIHQLHLEGMEYGEVGQGAYEHALSRSYLERGVKFYRLFATLADLSIHEVVLHSQELGSDIDAIMPFDWSSIRHHRRNVSKKDIVDNQDDFIIPNGLNAVDSPRSRTAFQAPHWTQSQDHIFWQHALDYSLLYGALTWTNGAEGKLDEYMDIQAAADHLDQLLSDGTEVSQLPLGTILEFVSMKMDVSDVDEASTRFQELSTSTNEHVQQAKNRLQRIGDTRALDIIGNQEPTITLTYDTILQNWIAPLPSNVPVRVRQNKERLARRVAAEVMLASTRCRRDDLEGLDNGPKPGPSQESNISLPVLPSKPAGMEQEWLSSQSLPTASQSSMPPSSQLLPPPPTKPPAPSSNSHPLTRLRKHLYIGETSTTEIDIPPNVDQLLSHWRVGDDPSTYDWDATERALRPDRFDETSQEQREKAQRKKERRAKRQQREDELMKTKAFSQPIVVQRSSPGPMFKSSSQVQPQGSSQGPLPAIGFGGPGTMDLLAPMSQIEPGRFGGRQDKKKKKKARNSNGGIFHTDNRVPSSGREKGWTSGDGGVAFPNSADHVLTSSQHAYIFSDFMTALSDRVCLWYLYSYRIIKRNVRFPEPPTRLHAGTQLVIVPMVSGTVKSEPGFEPKLDAELHGVGYDYIRNDADGGNMRLDVRSQLKNHDGTLIAMYYKGTVALTAGVKAVLSGSADAKTTDYGDSFVNFTFETGSEAYKGLQNGTYVAAGHFVNEPGQKGLIVEYKVSKVVKG
ncbi:hypothetical protein IQ07DRAFT_595839 [Pyrenochaeta sp. DS3sAY3a]|nr:hypothetical protein IQ07DRAFT_595839 [Pyrenochaeta sp. DS3sAY3a]